MKNIETTKRVHTFNQPKIALVAVRGTNTCRKYTEKTHTRKRDPTLRKRQKPWQLCCIRGGQTLHGSDSLEVIEGP